MLTEYTSYDEIRAALGVAPEEITDDVLALPNYESILLFDLADLGAFTPAVVDYYSGLVAQLPTSLSVDEARFVSILNVYAPYVIARHLTISIDMFAPKIITDSKTTMTRIQDPYKDTKAGIQSFYELMRARLIAAYTVLFPLATPPTKTLLISLLAIGLATDPVTGV